MLFRKFLIRIRKEYNENFRNLVIYSSVSTGLFLLVSIFVDWIFPFGSWYTFLRSFMLIPLALSIFVISYTVSLLLHYGRIESDPTWVPFRMRYSPTWRRRFSIIIAAIGLVFLYGFNNHTGYTLVSSIYAAVIIGLFAFMRTTSEESKREEYNIPDQRDTVYDYKVKQREQKRKEIKREKDERKKERRQERFGVKPKEKSGSE